jgi:hypothetical protein
VSEGARRFAEYIDANYTGVECFQTDAESCDGVVAVTDSISVLGHYLSSLAPGTVLATGEGQKEEG